MKRQDPLQKATRRIETEGRKHCLCIYSATAMALWQYWGTLMSGKADKFLKMLEKWAEAVAEMMEEKWNDRHCAGEDFEERQ